MKDITEKALLVKLSVGLPGNARKDKRITGEVQAQHKLSGDAGKWIKQLYPDQALKPLSELETIARTYHYEQTLPWTDEGWRILPAVSHFEYSSALRELRSKFESLRDDHFLAKYDEWVQWARTAHNGTFTASDYPGAYAIAKRFKFGCDFRPIPTGADFRVQLSSEEIEAIKQASDQAASTALAEAQKDLWRRLIEPVAAMAERLKDPENTFRNSLVGNIRDIVALVPKLNLTGDKTLSDFAVRIERELSRLDAGVLRDDKATRAEAAAKAEAIFKQMEGYL